MKLLDILELGNNLIEDLAYSLKFYKEEPKKITATNLVRAFLETTDEANVSYNKIAQKINEICDHSPSKQAVFKRVNEAFLEILKTLFNMILKKVSKEETPFYSFWKYKRIIVQDSTIVRLPFKLYDEFSGVKNGTSTVCNARLQYAIDIKKMELIHFSINTYSENDALMASELETSSMDLIIRDRGYLSISEIERHINNNSDYIFRHKSKTIYKDIETNKPINLLKKLKKKRNLDEVFYLNNDNKTKVRIIATPVPKEVSDKRKEKAKKESSSKSNISAETLKLMEWSIYITNITGLSFDIIEDLYRIRWWVEIIFKTLKTNLKLDDIHNVSKVQLEVLIYSKLIISILAQKLVYVPYSDIIKDEKTLSMVKLFGIIKMNLSGIIQYIISAKVATLDDPCEDLRMIMKYCCYEKRKRSNFKDLLDSISDSVIEPTG